MFFGRIYRRGKPFKPSWRSYAAYAAIIALILAGIDFNVLNALPGNAMGNVLLAVPIFYFFVAVIFLVSDLFMAAWRWFRGKRRARRRK
jgi:hypothetical protein